MARLHSSALTCLAFLPVFAALNAQVPSAPAMDWSKARVTTTELQLAEEVKAARPMMDQLAVMTRPITERVPTEGHSLYSKSIILYDGEMFTLVPIGSVLHLPANLRNRVVGSPQGTFILWPEFLQRNSSWLGAKEVPLKMAKGDAHLAQAVLQEVQGSPRLLVSVYRQCPISVLEAPRPATASANP